MELTAEDKQKVVNTAVEAAALPLTHAFETCGFKDKIEAMVINDNDGKEYVLTFYPASTFTTRRVKEYDSRHNVRDRFSEFVKSQKDLDPEIAEIVNENFWDLL